MLQSIRPWVRPSKPIFHQFVTQDGCLKIYRSGKFQSSYYLSNLDWKLIDRLKSLHSEVLGVIGSFDKDFYLKNPVIRVSREQEREIRSIWKKLISTENMLTNRLSLDRDSIYRVFNIKKAITVIKK